MSKQEELALRFEVHGTPVPQPRPRFVGHVVSTMGPRAKRWRSLVRMACDEAATRLGEATIEQIGGTGQHEGGRGGGHFRAVRLDMEFRFPVPKGENARIGRPHGLRPDKDNLEKAVMDEMQAAGLLVDDGRVADGRVRKVWSSARQAGLTVVMRPLSGDAAVAALGDAGEAPGWLGATVVAGKEKQPV